MNQTGSLVDLQMVNDESVCDLICTQVVLQAVRVH